MSREIVLSITDADAAREAISRDPRDFGSWMRDALTAHDRDAFDSARYHLRETFRVAIVSTKETF